MRTLLVTLVCCASACQCGDVRLGTLRLSLVVRPDAIDFGAVAQGAQGVREITFENVSRAPIDVNELELQGSSPGAFMLAPARPFRLEPGQSRTIDAVYAPTSAGVHSAIVRVASTSSNGELLVPLVGVTGLEEFDAGAAVDAGQAPADAGEVTDAGAVDAGALPVPSCGPANGSDTTVRPTSGLCALGAATPVSGRGPWRWACEGAGPAVECSTASYWVTGEHEELRSVVMGRPHGAQRYVSNMTRLEFVNNTQVAVNVVVRVVDPQNRFLWNDGTPMVMRPEVTATVQPGRRVAPSLLWNSPDDTGAPGDPCNQVTSPAGVEFLVGGVKVASFKVHAMSRAPFTCAGGLVTWSASAPNSGGPCRAMVPPAREFDVPEEVQASSTESDPGFTGKQGLSCVANAWTMDQCGVRVPTAGTPITAFPKYGLDACTQ